MAPASGAPRIEANRNIAPAGDLRDGILTLHLVIREGAWHPEDESGPAVGVQAFGEEGRALQIPGPLIRVPAGTEVRATVRNTLPRAAEVHGLYTRPGGNQKPIDVPPNDTREARFRLDAPGTYFYRAKTTDRPLTARNQEDSQLAGAIVVDRPGETTNDRVFLIGLWSDFVLGVSPRAQRAVAVINGKSWPFTERLTYRIGERVRWRWINTSFSVHAMHLHGAYFRVVSEGREEMDTAFPAELQREVVTDRIGLGQTREFLWVPAQEGRWLFHCHMLEHMSDEYRYFDAKTSASGGNGHSQHDAAGMAGLVQGITVLPGDKATAAPSNPAAAGKLTLLVRERPPSEGVPLARVFQLQDGPQPPPVEAAAVPGPPIVLVQGQPVEITIVNQLRAPTAVHWHGIELESIYDGVPGWGGAGREVTPPVEPGKSFVARFTPPRAGTFIYHTHWHDTLQLSSGLYGPLIVLKPGEKYDPETDLRFVIGLGGPDDFQSPLVLNGSPQPSRLQLKAGVRYRFRFIQITPGNAGLEVALLAGVTPVRWRALAKDGQDLPPAQATERDAHLTVTVGETYDFEFQPSTPGTLRLEVLRPAPQSRSRLVMEVQVR